MKTTAMLSIFLSLGFSHHLFANEFVIDEMERNTVHYDVGLAAKLKLSDMVVLVANDENPNFTEEMKLDLIAENSNPKLSPFDIRANKAQILQKYNDVLEKTKSYVYADKILVKNQITGAFLFFDTYPYDKKNRELFEQYYDFDKEAMYFTSDPCKENRLLSHSLPLMTSETICQKAYFKLPQEIAVKLFYPKTPSNKRVPPLISYYDLELSNNKKVAHCLHGLSMCIQTTFEKGNIRIVDRETKQVLYQTEIKLEK